MEGGDRHTLTRGGHFVDNCTVHHNQRWVLNYAPNVLMAGVGQTTKHADIYGSPQIGVFMQGGWPSQAITRLAQCTDDPPCRR